MEHKISSLNEGIKFTVPCFVRVDNAEERKKLLDWCEDIGYRVCSCASFDGWNTITCSMVERNGILFPEVHGIPDKDPDTGYSIEQFKMDNGQKPFPEIDCGGDVLMFKAIAALNDKNDREQWIIDRRGGWLLCGFNSVEEFVVNAGCGVWPMWVHDFRKATVEEVIDHFQKPHPIIDF